MCEPLTIIAITTAVAAGGVKIYGQLEEGKAQARSYNYQAALARQNAELVRQQTEAQTKAIDVTATSNISAVQDVAVQESKKFAASTSLLTGAQKATIGALGVSGVTAADITKSTFDQSQLDQLAIRYNANVRSFQFREKAKQDIFRISESAKMKRFSLESEASQLDIAAKQAKKASRIRATGTLLETASTVAGLGAKVAAPKTKPAPRPITV